MKQINKIIIGIIVVDIAVTLLTFLLPVPSSWLNSNSLIFHLSVAYSVVYSFFYFGAALLFLVELRSYRAQMRRAYVLLATGIIVTAITFLQVPVLSALGLWQNPIVAGGAPGIPYILAGLFLYAGMRKFAHLVGVRSWATSFVWVIVVAVVCAALATFLPHGQASLPDELTVDIFTVIIAWIGTFSAMSAVVVGQVRAQIGELYVNAMAWLLLALGSSVMVIVITLVYTLWLPNDTFSYLVVNPFIIISSLVYLKAGQAFTKTKDY